MRAKEAKKAKGRKSRAASSRSRGQSSPAPTVSATALSDAFEKFILSDSESSQSDAECPICGLTFYEDSSQSTWVCCDGCMQWYDFKCTGLKNPNKLPKKYFCNHNDCV